MEEVTGQQVQQSLAAGLDTVRGRPAVAAAPLAAHGDRRAGDGGLEAWSCLVALAGCRGSSSSIVCLAWGYQSGEICKSEAWAAPPRSVRELIVWRRAAELSRCLQGWMLLSQTRAAASALYTCKFLD